MKKSWNVLLVLLLALPAYGQDQPSAADQPAADTPPAEGVPADTPPADTGAVMDSISTDSTAETVATIPVEEVAAAPSTPWRLYAGYDWVRDTVSASNLSGFPTGDYDSGMNRLRFGAKIFEAIGVEAQFGANRGEKRPGTAETKSYYGVFLVPTASLFDTLELTFPVGYARNKVERTGGSASLSSLSYALNAVLPIRTFSASLPDVRFEAGWAVYYQKTDARIYGFNAGLAYNFDVNGGSPFSGMSGMGDKVGGFFKSLWPFGKDEAAPAPAPEATPPADEPPPAQ